MTTIDLNELTAELSSGPQVLAAASKSGRGRGKTPYELGAEPVRELTAEDVEIVGQAEVGVSTTPQLQNIRSSHHRLAQLLAVGYTNTQASLVTGYSPSRISVLRSDPAFKELLATYAKQRDEIFADTTEKMKHVTDDALGVLHDRILDEPESFSNTHLVELVAKVGDRAGYSPVTKSVNLNLPIDPDRLADIKNKVKENQRGQVKQISQEAINAEYSVVQDNQETPDSEIVRAPANVCKETEAEGEPGEGVDL